MSLLHYLIIILHLYCLVSCSNKEVCDSPWAYEEKSDEQELPSVYFSLKHETNIFDLSDDLLIEIGEYLINPISTLSRLNKIFNTIFYKTFPVKYFAFQRFNIPELESVADKEYELIGVLNLYWCRNDPFLFFGCLFEDITSGKKRFNNILKPLISYLVRLYNDFDEENKSYFKDELYSLIECYWNDYNLISEIINIKVPNLILYLIEIEDGKSVISFLRSNPDLALRFEAALLFEGIDILNFQVSRWLSNCIIYDAPYPFYIPLLISAPFLLNSLCEYSNLFLSPDIPESEYPRIHSLLNNLFIRFLTVDDDIPFWILLNDIRFGLVVKLQNDFKFKSKNNFSLAVQVALLENKTDIVLQLFHQRRKYNVDDYGYGNIMLNVLDNIDDFKNCKQINSLKLIFNMILLGCNLFPSVSLLSIVLKLYNFDHIDIENDKLIIEFRVNKDFGFPSIIRFDLGSVYDCLIKNIKLLDENALLSLITYQIIKPDSELFVNFKFFELVTKSQDLFEKFVEAGIKLNFNLFFHDRLEEDFDFSIFDGKYSVLISKDIFIRSIYLTYIKNKRNFKYIEKFKGRTVADYFYDWQDERISQNRDVTEFDYFKWRQVFAYWIKSDQNERERINDIKFHVFINLLKSEFPEEMSQLLVLTN